MIAPVSDWCRVKGKGLEGQEKAGRRDGKI
jgi:hypothetical protein